MYVNIHSGVYGSKNIEYFDIGLTSDATQRLSANEADDVVVVFRALKDGQLEFTLNSVFNDTRTLAALTAEEAGTMWQKQRSAYAWN